MYGFSNALPPAKFGRKDGLDSAPNFVPDGEGDSLLMEPLACPELVPSPPILNSSYFMADAQLCSVSHQLNQLPSSQAHARNLVSTTLYAGSHGTNVPRFRAQRGKATDPHSIAERHRRERISDRMKSLHDLIPNSNKTDKASMLDEIIDYIKFLQLEMKKPRGRLASASAGSSGSSDASQEDDNGTTGAESGNKELSVMPIELASAISTKKGTHTAVIPTEMQIMDSAISGAPFLGIPF